MKTASEISSSRILPFLPENNIIIFSKSHFVHAGEKRYGVPDGWKVQAGFIRSCEERFSQLSGLCAGSVARHYLVEALPPVPEA